MKKIHIFTHGDLDGVTSYIALCWFHPNAVVSYTTVGNASTIRESVLGFLAKHSFADYDKVYFTDLDCYDAKDLIEHDNVVVIDHHQAHFEKVEAKPYKKLQSIVKVYPSCCLLIYKIFSKVRSDIQITKAQKTLIGIVDDYDSYALKIKYSVLLNWVFYSYNNRFEAFSNRFYNGFSGFSTQEQSMIKIKKDRLERTIAGLEIYKGKIKDYTVLSCFADECINEVHDYILGKYKPDITVVIVPKPGRVTWRKNKECDAPLHVYAEKICDGGGHEYAAGGDITDRFLALSKKLEPFDG